MTPHINAKEGEIAKIVIMPGDPKRAAYIAENYLKDAELITNVRYAFGYTGTYKGKKVTVMSSGMGMPSMAIYAYELFNFYGVEKIIRVGSCKSLVETIEINDIILATEAYTLSNFAYSYGKDKINRIKSTSSLNSIINKTAKELDLKINKGLVATSDVFYHDYIDKKEKKYKAIGLEMESFGLFYLAHKLKKQATAILTVSDSDYAKKNLSVDARKRTFDDAIVLALSSIIKEN